MTPWIVKTLWLISALPMLAAGLSALARLAGTECRQAVAHGASRGDWITEKASPGASEEIFQPVSESVTMKHLPPLPGLGLCCTSDPRLSPWATALRHSVAYK
jgi:hypothetical protein